MKIYSKKLSDLGLANLVGGSNYNFRYKTQNKKVIKDVEDLLFEMKEEPFMIYSAFQDHTDHVKVPDMENTVKFAYGRIILNTDAMVTNEKNVALLIKMADCTPIILFDPVKKVQAVVHSGWRGTCKEIGAKAAAKMESTFFCKRENICAYIGPTISIDDYEVGEEVYEAFEKFTNRDSFFEKKCSGKYHLNMKQANLDVLLRAGIKEENIELERESTFGNPHLHSARYEGENYGLNAIISIIK